jgi:hypothetical protein
MWAVFQDFCATLAWILSAVCLVAIAYFFNAWAVIGFIPAIAPLAVSAVFLFAAWFITSLASHNG